MSPILTGGQHDLEQSTFFLQKLQHSLGVSSLQHLKTLQFEGVGEIGGTTQETAAQKPSQPGVSGPGGQQSLEVHLDQIKRNISAIFMYCLHKTKS